MTLKARLDGAKMAINQQCISPCWLSIHFTNGLKHTAYTCTHTHAHTHTHTHAHVPTHAHTRTHARTHASTHAHTYIYTTTLKKALVRRLFTDTAKTNTHITDFPGWGLRTFAFTFGATYPETVSWSQGQHAHDKPSHRYQTVEIMPNKANQKCLTGFLQQVLQSVTSHSCGIRAPSGASAWFPQGWLHRPAKNNNNCGVLDLPFSNDL